VEAWRRLRFGLAALFGVLVAGTVGYVAFGFTLLDAGQILIAIGTEAQLKALAAAARP